MTALLRSDLVRSYRCSPLRECVRLCIQLHRRLYLQRDSPTWALPEERAASYFSPPLSDGWPASESLRPRRWRLAWCMSSRTRLINPTHQSAPDNYSSLLAFSFQRFALDNSQRLIRPRCSAPPCFGALFFLITLTQGYCVTVAMAILDYIQTDWRTNMSLMSRLMSSVLLLLFFFILLLLRVRTTSHSACHCSVPPLPVEIIR